MKLLFTEITQQERERILEMHKSVKNNLNEDIDSSVYFCINPQWEKKNIFTQDGKTIQVYQGMGEDVDVYNNKLSDMSFTEAGEYYVRGQQAGSYTCSDKGILLNGKPLTKMDNTNTKNTPSGAGSKGNQSRTVFDLVTNTKDSKGKRYNWKEVRDAWQKENPNGVLGSPEQNIALGKAWKSGWRPSDKPLKPMEKVPVDKVLTPNSTGKVTSNDNVSSNDTQNYGSATQTNNTDNTLKLKPTDRPVQQPMTPKDFYKNLYNSKLIKGEEGGEKLKYTGPNLNKNEIDLLTQAMSDMGYDRQSDRNKLIYRKRNN